MASSNPKPTTIPNPNPNPNPNNNNNNNSIPSLRTIEAALSLVESKKQNLKRAYETLTSFPSSSSFLPFSWSQLDSHFTSLHLSLSRRFHLLLHSYDSSIQPNPELLSACRNMDGIRLRAYVNGKDLDRTELVGSLREAPDPGGLVLDAVEGFCGFGLGEKKGCVLILEALREVGFQVGEGLRERAKRIGVEWRDFVVVNKGKRMGVEALGLLNLVASFGLGGEFDSMVLVECFVSVGASLGAPELCKAVGLGEQANGHLIQKLIDTEMELNAIKFICVLGLAGKFPPVPILKSWLEKVNKHCDECYKEETCSGSTKEDAIKKAINSMTEAFNIIDEFKLGYPKAELQKRIESMKKQKVDGLRGSSAGNKIQRENEQLKNHNEQQNERPGNQNEQKNEQPKKQNEQKKEQPKKQNQQKNKQPKKQDHQMQNANKRPRTSTPNGPTPPPIGFAGTGPSLPRPGLLATSTPYGFVNRASVYGSPSVGTYGFPGAPSGYPQDPNMPGAHLYPPQPYVRRPFR